MSQLELDPIPSDAAVAVWHDVCPLDRLTPDRGLCALVDGQPVAVFRCSPAGELFAIGNVDPYSGASVLSRGIVGSIGARPVVASPMFKQRFDLRSGEALAEPEVRVPCYPVRLADGRIQVGTHPLDPDGAHP